MNRQRRSSTPPPTNPVRGPLLQQLARVSHALGSPARLAIVGLLSHGEKTVDQLARDTGQTLATASAHLKVLRGACVVVAEKRGRHVHCRLASERVLRFWLALRELGTELLPEAREVLKQFAEADDTLLCALSPSDLKRELKAGRITLVDLRPTDEFAAGHLPDAVNLPFSELPRLRKAELPFSTRGPVYVYCRGPYCVMLREGTRALQKLGVPARGLRFSVPEWRATFAKLSPLDGAHALHEPLS